MKVPYISLKSYYSLFISSMRRTHKLHRDNVRAANGPPVTGDNCVQTVNNIREIIAISLNDDDDTMATFCILLVFFLFFSSFECFNSSPFPDWKKKKNGIPYICPTPYTGFGEQSVTLFFIKTFRLSVWVIRISWRTKKNGNGDFWIILWFLSCVPVGEFNLNSNNIEQSTISTISTINILRIVFIASFVAFYPFVSIQPFHLFRSAYSHFAHMCRWFFSCFSFPFLVVVLHLIYLYTNP